MLTDTVPAQDNPFGLLLQREASELRQASDYYVFHEQLEDNNDPSYFHEFARRSLEAGLQFLGESELRGMLTNQLPAKMQAALREVGTSIIYAEQYMDFFRNRTFRQTLLCRREVTLNRRLSAESFRPFSFASRLTPPASANLDDDSPVAFAADDWPTATIKGRLGKATMAALADAWPDYLAAGELENLVRARLGLARVESASADFLEMLWNWFAQDIVRMLASPPQLARRPSAKPHASDQDRTTHPP